MYYIREMPDITLLAFMLMFAQVVCCYTTEPSRKFVAQQTRGVCWCQDDREDSLKCTLIFVGNKTRDEGGELNVSYCINNQSNDMSCKHISYSDKSEQANHKEVAIVITVLAVIIVTVIIVMVLLVRALIKKRKEKKILETEIPLNSVTLENQE